MKKKKDNEIKLIIDKSTLREYEKYYFSIHTKARKKPIPKPYHESINKWMIMQRSLCNALKQRWKAFCVWFVESKGLTNLRIDKCNVEFRTYYETNRSHDTDNSVPKFIMDGLVQGGLFIDDSSNHINPMTLWVGVDIEHPRTEIIIRDIVYENK